MVANLFHFQYPKRSRSNHPKKKKRKEKDRKEGGDDDDESMWVEKPLPEAVKMLYRSGR
jgi:hypothetical protein